MLPEEADADWSTLPTIRSDGGLGTGHPLPRPDRLRSPVYPSARREVALATEMIHSLSVPSPRLPTRGTAGKTRSAREG